VGEGVCGCKKERKKIMQSLESEINKRRVVWNDETQASDGEKCGMRSIHVENKFF
jgi:hypothetical protein